MDLYYNDIVSVAILVKYVCLLYIEYEGDLYGERVEN